MARELQEGRGAPSCGGPSALYTRPGAFRRRPVLCFVLSMVAALEYTQRRQVLQARSIGCGKLKQVLSTPLSSAAHRWAPQNTTLCWLRWCHACQGDSLGAGPQWPNCDVLAQDSVPKHAALIFLDCPNMSRLTMLQQQVPSISAHACVSTAQQPNAMTDKRISKWRSVAA